MSDIETDTTQEVRRLPAELLRPRLEKSQGVQLEGQMRQGLGCRQRLNGQADAALLCSLTAFSIPGCASAKSAAFMHGENVKRAL